VNKLWMFFLIVMSIAGVVAGWVHQAMANSLNDSERLINASKAFIHSDSKLTFKYTGVYGACTNQDDLRKRGASLSNELGLPVSLEPEHNQEHIYATEMWLNEQDSISLKLMLLEPTTECYMVLKREKMGLAVDAELNQWQKQQGSKLADLGIDGEWNVMLQGVAVGEITEPSALMGRLTDKLQGQVLETYQDQGTLSYSLFSDNLNAAIQSGDHLMNLQVAVHRESDTGQLRVTVGSPIITAEY
jgi:hypothetical protein